MEGDETIHPLTDQNNNINPTYNHHDLFTPSSSSFDPSTTTSFPYTNAPLLPLPPLQNHTSPFENLDIDWISLLSGKPPNFTPGNYEGDQSNGGHGKHKGKNSGSRMSKKSVPSRIAFHTRSTEDILDDGFKWRKYGQKSVKNSKHPRSYYRCTHHTCNVKKQIQRLSKDNGVLVTTYEGIHNHPCEKLMETLSPLLKQLQFLSRF